MKCWLHLNYKEIFLTNLQFVGQTFPQVQLLSFHSHLFNVSKDNTLEFKESSSYKNKNPSHCTPPALPRALPVKTSTSRASIFATVTFDAKLDITVILPTTQKPVFNQFGILDDGVNRKRLTLQLFALFSVKSPAKAIKF